jgi:hypothetical protein
VSKLAALIEAKVAKHVPAERPKLEIVGKKGVTKLRGEDDPPRARLLYRIRDFAIMYSLAWLVRQETTFYGRSLEELGDEELGEVMKKLERALECRNDDVSFVDAGLVRCSLADELGY